MMLGQGFAWADNNAEVIQKKAMDAFKTGNYKLAEELFKDAIAIEESDVLWLNLGRTYMRQNRCLEAQNAYAKVNLAQAKPIVIDKYEEYRKDLILMCTCEVQIVCYQSDAQIYIDNVSAEIKCGEKVMLTPGVHIFREESSAENLVTNVELESDGKLQKVDFNTVMAEKNAAALAELQKQKELESLRDELVQANDQVEQMEERAKYSRMRMAGYTLMGVGVAGAVASGAVLGGDWNYCTYYNCQSDAEYNDYKKSIDRQPGLYAGIAVSSAVAVTGVVLTVLGHVLDSSADSNNDSDGSEAAIHVQPVFNIMPVFAGGGIAVSF